MTDTVATLLRETHSKTPLDPAEARILLAYALSWPRTALITRDQEPLPTQAVEHYRSLVTRRQHGEPVAYLVGEREFFGLTFAVTPDVLIPRPETELLVEQGLLACADLTAPAFLDLGTGSGAIAIALAHVRPDARITATDCSEAALAIAQHNAAHLLEPHRAGGPLRFLCGDWFNALQASRFHLIVSNPPYIRAGDTHLQQGDLRFEPDTALTDHADGLSAIRTIVSRAPHYLHAGGTLWLEHGYGQANAAAELLRARGFADVSSVRDLAGIARVTGGRWP